MGHFRFRGRTEPLITRAIQVANTTLRVGLIGLSITLALNVFGLFVLRQAAARFLTGDWWTVWFPSFIAWFCMTTMGPATIFS